MIGQTLLNDKGELLEQYKTLSKSKYQPPQEVMKLFEKVQRDYQTAYMLQNRSFDEFDGYSLLQRAKMDQETFSAYVGIEYLPAHKKWRWRGRRNTARNKLIGILSHMLAAMLFPVVRAQNENDEEDKGAARVMAILVEEYLRKAGYEMKFLYIVLSALVNPAVFVNVEFVKAFQRVKQKTASGKYEVKEVLDEFLSGLNLNILPIDEVMLGDFYTFDIRNQPFILRVRRIGYEKARNIYGKNKNFEHVQPGQTHVLLNGADGEQQLFDIDWTEADANFVQEITAYYLADDMEVTWVGGVFMGNEEDVWNGNPFTHRRVTLHKDEWITVPVYPFAKTGFEPIDPSCRFAYYKSGAFKEYWDDKGINQMDRLMMDGSYLEVIKPIFISGAAKIDSTVVVPGASVALPADASVTPYSVGSNLAAAYNAIRERENALSESTQDKIMQGNVEKGVTAYATNRAEQNARIFLGVFGLMTANLVEQIGELTTDCVTATATVGDVDMTAPESVRMKFKTITSRGSEKGRNVTRKIVFTDKNMGYEMSPEEVRAREWELYKKTGGEKGDQRIFEVNPYLFARRKYFMYVDADQIVQKSMGTDRQQSILAFNMLTDQRVAPFTDQEAVVNDFIIDEFSNGNPERYKRKGKLPEELLNGMMNQAGPTSGGMEAMAEPGEFIR